MPWADEMVNDTSTADSSFGTDDRPDWRAQGQAALLLVESLIHTLLDNGTLSKHQAADAVESAMQVKEESAGDDKEPVRTLRKSVNLLLRLQESINAHSGRYDASPEAGPGASSRP